jgi:hypothetical protein
MDSPLTPPPELVQQWEYEWNTLGKRHPAAIDPASYVAVRAAQWGADQELEACRQYLEINGAPRRSIDGLLAFRRPKPPSLKEQALLQLDTLNADLAMHGRGCDLSQIRRALEQLPND